MSANTGNGGVRNLRAMFENKGGDQSTSPPSRGRSPNPSEFSNGSRPVSKVRASFVAIERPGENGTAPLLGLRRASEVSSRGESKEAAIVEETMEEETPLAADEAATKSTPTSLDTAPASDNASFEGGLGNILKGSAFIENTPTKVPSASTIVGNGLRAIQSSNKTPKSPSKPKDEVKAAAMVEKMKPVSGQKPGPPPTTILQTTETAQPVKPLPTRQERGKPAPVSPSLPKNSPRTPTSPVAKIRGGPAKIKAVMESAKEAQQAREEMAKQNIPATTKGRPTAPKVDTQSHPKVAHGAPKKDRPPTSPRTARSPMVTKPKSPSLPAKIPVGATATTASSAAKADPQHSPTETAHKSLRKKSSTLSVPHPRPSTASTTTSLAKKTSRASLANGHERPKSRVSTSRPDEGFLARMMRPTASSAQKVHEKAQIQSPPRSKVVPAGKAGKKPPPKMSLGTITQAVGENKENDHNNQVEAVPASPLDTVTEDAFIAESHPDPIAPEPTTAAAEGDAQAQAS